MSNADRSCQMDKPRLGHRNTQPLLDMDRLRKASDLMKQLVLIAAQTDIMDTNNNHVFNLAWMMTLMNVTAKIQTILLWKKKESQEWLVHNTLREFQSLNYLSREIHPTIQPLRKESLTSKKAHSRNLKTNATWERQTKESQHQQLQKAQIITVITCLN